MYTADPELDAAAWEDFQDSLQARQERQDAERRAELFSDFRESLAMDEPSPRPNIVGADIETLICEHPDLVAKVLGAVARNHQLPGISHHFHALAEAWIDDLGDAA